MTRTEAISEREYEGKPDALFGAGATQNEEAAGLGGAVLGVGVCTWQYLPRIV
jgi:hypothetical protein